VDEFDKAAALILESKRLVIFTGAGVSTESGIPDFRSPGGLWDKYDPDEFNYSRFISSQQSREKYWDFSKSLWPTIAAAEPNPAHLAIAELDRLRKLDCVITQNIDGLHQKAGVPEGKVIELHGTIKWVVCLSCGKRYPREEIQERLKEGVKAPTCDDCSGVMKPATISFGQAMPEKETREAEERSVACDLFVTVGSSLVVYPAAQMPLIAKRSGGKLIIINLAPTPHDPYADLIIHRKAGEAMQEIINRLRPLLS
jgi:NAD-dependent deacetylase